MEIVQGLSLKIVLGSRQGEDRMSIDTTPRVEIPSYIENQEGGIHMWTRQVTI